MIDPLYKAGMHEGNKGHSRDLSYLGISFPHAGYVFNRSIHSPKGRGKESRISRVSLISQGFTLLEVLISIVILVLGAIAILPMFGVASQSHKRGMDQTQASLIAPRIAAQIQANLTDVRPRDIREGTYVEFGQTYRYDATFTRIAPGSAQDPLGDAAFVLQVKVKWKEGSGDHVENFETIVLRKIPR